MPEGAAPRVSPPRIEGRAARAPRPPLDAAGPAAAHRQTGFVLGEELDYLVATLNLEGSIAEASAGAKYRNQVVAASLGLWSRSWLCRLQAMHAVEWGNYAAAFPLIRVAADLEAASLETLRTGAEEWQSWLSTGGIATAPADRATAFRLAGFRSGSEMAADPALSAVYRLATDLSMPHFASTLLLVAGESTPERILVTFGDRDFHLGLAELTLGSLVGLAIVRLRLLSSAAPALASPQPAQVEQSLAAGLSILDRNDRCRAEIVERDGAPRYLIHQWRRQPGSRPRRILL